MLTTSEKALLEVVLETAGDDEKMIHAGVVKAIRGDKASQGEAGKARWKHLWTILPNAAKERMKERIHRVRQKVAA